MLYFLGGLGSIFVYLPGCCFSSFLWIYFDGCTGPAGPQGPLRGPYPGSSPPGQQMRGPMMANNTGPRPPYMAGPNQGALRGPAGNWLYFYARLHWIVQALSRWCIIIDKISSARSYPLADIEQCRRFSTSQRRVLKEPRDIFNDSFLPSIRLFIHLSIHPSIHPYIPSFLSIR